MSARSPRQKRGPLFFVAAAVLPLVLLLGASEGLLRLFDYPHPRPLFVPAPFKLPGRDYLIVNPRVAERYFSRHDFVPAPPDEAFLKVKPPHGYRIFVLGDSTAAGWPYPNNVMFSRLLRQRLADTFPDREIEVVNTAIAAVSSYTLLDFLDEILAQQPDALLIYAGHNEFYGALGAASGGSGGAPRPLVRLYLALARLKTVALLRELILNAQKSISGGAPGDVTLMARMIGDASIPLGGPVYRQGKEQFAANLGDLLGRARAAHVPVLVSELVSNVRDHPPFVSAPAADQPPAGEIFQQARGLEAAGRFGEARQAYRRAKDLDAMRFRASEEFNDIIRRVAAEHSVPVVPMLAVFEQAAPNGLVGASLMLEHLHPNVEGHLLMGQAFFDAMRRHGFIEPTWNEARIKPLDYYRQTWGVSDLDRAVAMYGVLNLTDHWPFQPTMTGSGAVKNYRPRDRSEELAREVFFSGGRSLRRARLSMAAHYVSLGQHDKAVTEYRALVAADPLNIDNYLQAASTLAENGQYRQALPFLQESLKLKETGFAYQWLGQLLLAEEKVGEAIPLLEKAAAIDAPNPVLLYNLSQAYLSVGRRDQATATAARLAKQFPGHPAIQALRRDMAAGQ